MKTLAYRRLECHNVAFTTLYATEGKALDSTGAAHPCSVVEGFLLALLKAESFGAAQLYGGSGKPRYHSRPVWPHQGYHRFVRVGWAFYQSLPNLMFGQVVVLALDDPLRHPTTFTEYRDRLFNGMIMAQSLEKSLSTSILKPLLSNQHFSVDGTLLNARAPFFLKTHQRQGWSSYLRK
jgi:hypothetical protein